MRQASNLVDRLSREEGRTRAPVGGSDSHGDWLRPTTWVLAKEKSVDAIRDAVASGRTCARAPEPCTLEARGDGDWVTVGGAIVSRDELLRLVWGYSNTPTTRTVDNFIFRLRNKLEPDPHHPRYIRTVHGDGYRLTLND